MLRHKMTLQTETVKEWWLKELEKDTEAAGRSIKVKKACTEPGKNGKLMNNTGDVRKTWQTLSMPLEQTLNLLSGCKQEGSLTAEQTP